MKTYNVAPYYDDFAGDNNYYQVLFKPGYAVQARELTQLQTILRDQINKFGNHIFQQGSVVIPGNAFTDLGVPYIKLDAINPITGAAVSATDFEGKIISGLPKDSGNQSTSTIRAYVRKAVASTGSDPITLYLSYITGAGSTATTNKFVEGDEIYSEANPDIRATLSATTATGVGSMAFINKGVFYVNGTFVEVAAHSAVIGKYTAAPSCHVLLKIAESIVTNENDETLLDPAQGSYNYAAPGADRVQITLTLTTLPLGSEIGDDYVELMRYEDGILKENIQYARYSELEKSLARRTYDESGDYVVSGFNPTIREHLKTIYNSGVYTDGSADKFVVDVSPGKGYIKGFETEVISTTRLSLDRARTDAHVKQKEISARMTYGSYLYVANLVSLPNFKTNELVTLYNASSGGSAIGTARVTGIDFHAGDPSASPTTDVYKLYYKDITLNAGYSLSDVGRIQFTGGTATVVMKYTAQNTAIDFAAGEIITSAGTSRAATVKKYERSTGSLYAFKHSSSVVLPLVGDSVSGPSTASATIRSIERSGTLGSAAPLFNVPVSPIKTLTDSQNQYDMAYTVWKTFTVSTDGSGNGSYTISDGKFIQPDQGITVAASTAGVVPISKMSGTTNNTFSIAAGPASSSVVVCTQVEKINTQPKSKTLISATITANAASEISLGKADVYRVVSVVNGTTDITNQFVLDNGQTDYYYGIGKLIRVGTVADTTPLTITFEYFLHGGAGDYFSVDSYTSMGSDYLSLIPTYRSPLSSQNYPLKDYIDFRPRIGDDGTFTSGTALTADAPVVDAFLTSSAKYFVPRIDVIALDKSRNVFAVSGIPGEVPIKPTVPSNAIELFNLYIPAYTPTVTSIYSTKAKNSRFTMEDINKLQDRVANIEYYSTLNSIENSLLTYQVADAATGLNRYKTGYLVDNFDNPFAVCDYYNPYNRSNFSKRKLTAAVETHDAGAELLVDSANYQITGDQITLPYQEVPFISQKTSTRVTNLNPFMVFDWEGVMTIEPPADSWIETQDLPSIHRDVTNTIIIKRFERVEVPYFVDIPLRSQFLAFTAPALPPVPAPTVTRLTQSVTAVNVSTPTGDLRFNLPESSFWFSLNAINTWSATFAPSMNAQTTTNAFSNWQQSLTVEQRTSLQPILSNLANISR